MKLYVYYESNFKTDRTWFETDEDEVNLMIDRDYQERLAKAEDKDSVERRDAQTILTEEISKPTYNSHHRYARRSVLLSALDPDGKLLHSAQNVEQAACGGRYSELHDAMKQLQPQQRRLLKKIFWKGMSQADIAREEGVAENTISDRVRRAKASLKRILENEKKFSE